MSGGEPTIGASLEKVRVRIALAAQRAGRNPDDVRLVAVTKGRAAAGDAAGALTALEQAQRRAPARADLHKLQGDIALQVGDKRGALAAYGAALDLDPGYVQVWLDLGRLHEDREAWRDAQHAYERALELVDRLDLDSYQYLHSTRGELLRRLGRLEDARDAYERALELASSEPERRFLARRIAEL